MERELEIKVLGIDPLEIEESLRSLGAKMIADENQTNILIVGDSEHNQISQGSYLRIRSTIDNITDEEVHFLTYKQKLENDKLRENIEYTTIINSVSDMIEILKKLGYVLHSKGYKHRKSFILSDARIDIDIWDKETYPHPYLEIEVPNIDVLNSTISKLNIDKDNISYKSIKELQDELFNMPR